MAYPTRTPSLAMGGTRTWQARTLRKAMKLINFDPDASGAGWVLHVSDIHFFAHATLDDVTELSQGITEELLALAEMPPQFVVANGDILTEYSPDRGYGPWPAGTTEASYANAEMHKFSDLAPLVVTTGNHDSAPNETPYDNFLATNCASWYAGAGGLQSWTCGGVLCLAIPQRHDASMQPEEIPQANAILAAATASQDIALFYHAPGFARVVEGRISEEIPQIVPAGMENPIWAFCGHTHTIYSNVWEVADTTLIQHVLGATMAPLVDASTDKTNQTMVAIAMSGGRVRGLFHFDGRTRLWTVMESPGRTPAGTIPQRADGIVGTPLTEYWEGEYDRTGIMLSTPNLGGTFRDAMSWIRSITECVMKFPIPATAKKLWVSMVNKPTNIELSGNGTDYETVAVPTLSSSIATITIPVGLQGGSYLWVRVTNASACSISGWGFLA